MRTFSLIMRSWCCNKTAWMQLIIYYVTTLFLQFPFAWEFSNSVLTLLSKFEHSLGSGWLDSRAYTVTGIESNWLMFSQSCGRLSQLNLCPCINSAV